MNKKKLQDSMQNCQFASVNLQGQISYHTFTFFHVNNTWTRRSLHRIAWITPILCSRSTAGIIWESLNLFEAIFSSRYCTWPAQLLPHTRSNQVYTIHQVWRNGKYLRPYPQRVVLCTDIRQALEPHFLDRRKGDLQSSRDATSLQYWSLNSIHCIMPCSTWGVQGVFPPSTKSCYPGRGGQTELSSDQTIFERTHVLGALELHDLEKASSALLSGQWSENCLIRGHFGLARSDQRQFPAHTSLIRGQFERTLFWPEAKSITLFSIFFSFTEICCLWKESTKKQHSDQNSI